MAEGKGRKEWERLKAKMKDAAPSFTFEGRLGHLEALCRGTPGVLPNRPPEAKPEKGTEAWYAEEILLAIQAAHSLIGQGHASHAAAEALWVGALAQEWSSKSRRDEPAGQRVWLGDCSTDAKEQHLVSVVTRYVALADQQCDKYDGKRFALDMWIEFRHRDGSPSPIRVELQLKTGSSHLKTRADGSEVFRPASEKHISDWIGREVPVFLVVCDLDARVRWMEIREWLRKERDRAGEVPRQIVFEGEAFDVKSILKWRDYLVGD